MLAFFVSFLTVRRVSSNVASDLAIFQKSLSDLVVVADGFCYVLCTDISQVGKLLYSAPDVAKKFAKFNKWIARSTQ